MREVHLLGATWELWLDPSTCCFLAGAVVLRGKRALRRRRSSGRLGSGVGHAGDATPWLPLRSGLFMAWYLHDVLRTEYDAPDRVAAGLEHLDPGTCCCAGPVSGGSSAAGDCHPADLPKTPTRSGVARVRASGDPIAWAPARTGVRLSDPTSRHGRTAGRRIRAVGTVSVYWDPVGTRAGGCWSRSTSRRKKVWERTDKPFDTDWYGHKSGIQLLLHLRLLLALLRYVAADAADQRRRAGTATCWCIKTPTRPLFAARDRSHPPVRRAGRRTAADRRAHRRVRHRPLPEPGGPAVRLPVPLRLPVRHGLGVRADDSAPLGPHPVVQHVPWMDFATSCSLDVRGSSGRAVHPLDRA